MRAKKVEEQIALVAQKYEALKPYLTERSRRIWAATEAQLQGDGGQKIVHEATGISGTTIRRGVVEVNSAEEERVELGRIRQAGGGRKKKTTLDTRLKADMRQQRAATRQRHCCGRRKVRGQWLRT